MFSEDISGTASGSLEGNEKSVSPQQERPTLLPVRTGFHLSLFDGACLPLCPVPFGFIFRLMLFPCSDGPYAWLLGHRGEFLSIKSWEGRQGRGEQDWPSALKIIHPWTHSSPGDSSQVQGRSLVTAVSSQSSAPP